MRRHVEMQRRQLRIRQINIGTVRGDTCQRRCIGIARLPRQRRKLFGEIGGVLAAATSAISRTSPPRRRQHAPQHLKDRVAVARDMRTIKARIGYGGHPEIHRLRTQPCARITGSATRWVTLPCPEPQTARGRVAMRIAGGFARAGVGTIACFAESHRRTIREDAERCMTSTRLPPCSRITTSTIRSAQRRRRHRACRTSKAASPSSRRRLTGLPNLKVTARSRGHDENHVAASFAYTTARTPACITASRQRAGSCASRPATFSKSSTARSSNIGAWGTSQECWRNCAPDACYCHAPRKRGIQQAPNCRLQRRRTS